MEKEKNFVSVIFYVRNSEYYIGHFLESILNVIDKKFKYYELICVNNDSKDNSINIVKETIQQFNSENKVMLNIINMSECVSFEEAISSGMQLAIGDFIFEFDVPLIDYDIELIVEAYNKCLTDIDIVAASPTKKKGLFQKLYYSLYNFGVERSKKIHPERFRVISRRAINRVTAINNYYSLGVSVYKNCGLRTENLFFEPRKDIIKYDKDEFRERLFKAIEIIIVYTNSIQKIMLILAGILGIVSIISGLIVGWEFALIGMLFSNIWFIGAVLVQYISTSINLSYKKKIQLIKSIDKVVK